MPAQFRSLAREFRHCLWRPTELRRSDRLPQLPSTVYRVVEDAADTYTITIQAGAILAVVLIYWKRLQETVPA